MKILIIGEKEKIFPFQGLGVDIFFVKEKEDFKKAKAKLDQENYGLVFITQTIAKSYEKDLEDYFKKTLPAILVIPTLGEKSSEIYVRKILEKALGSEKLIFQ